MEALIEAEKFLIIFLKTLKEKYSTNSKDYAYTKRFSRAPVRFQKY
jgi:hypothetical protein